MSRDPDDAVTADAVAWLAALTRQVVAARIELRRTRRAIRHGYPLPAHVRRVLEEARHLRLQSILLRRRIAPNHRIH